MQSERPGQPAGAFAFRGAVPACLSYPLGCTRAVVEVLQTERFRRWLDGLRDRRTRARVAARIVSMQEGHFGDWKIIDRTVSELRVHAGSGHRVYFTRRCDTLVILLAGGDTQSQRRDIETARRLAAELSDP